MYMRPLTVRAETSFAQSHPYPCSRNEIAVTIVSSSPLYANCTPRFTIKGLTNTLTGDGVTDNQVYLDLTEMEPSDLEINGTSNAPKAHWEKLGEIWNFG